MRRLIENTMNKSKVYSPYTLTPTTPTQNYQKWGGGVNIDDSRINFTFMSISFFAGMERKCYCLAINRGVFSNF